MSPLERPTAIAAPGTSGCGAKPPRGAAGTVRTGRPLRAAARRTAVATGPDSPPMLRGVAIGRAARSIAGALRADAGRVHRGARDPDEDPRPAAARVAGDDVLDGHVERRDRRSLDDRETGAPHAGVHVAKRHDGVAGGSCRSGE